MNNIRIMVVIFVAFCVLAMTGCETDTLVIGEPSELTEVADRVDPRIEILTPTPGTFAVGDEVVVSGIIEVGSAPLTKITLNGSEIDYDGGDTFEVRVTLEAGPNIIGVRASAEDSGRGVDATTVYGASTHPPGEFLENALRVQIGPEGLDNDTSNLDDLAGILEALIKDEQFLNSFFDEPFEVSEDTTLTVERMDISDAHIDIDPTPGCLHTYIVLGDDDANKDGWVEIDLFATGIASIFGDLIFLSAESIQIEAYICPEGQEGEVTLEIYDTEVNFEGFRLATDESPELSDEYPTLTATLVGMAEDAMARWMAESMADLVLSLLEDFVPSYVFGTLPEITATFDMTGITVDTYGLVLDLDGSFNAPLGVPAISENAGSLRTDDPAMTGSFSDAPVAIAMSDDVLNQLLFAMWYGGGIADYELPAGEMDALPEVFQPLSMLEVSMYLPTTFLAPTYPEEFPFDMAAGGIDIDLRSGEDRNFEMGLHLRAGVGVEIDEEGLLSLNIDNRAQKIDVQAGVSATPPEHDPGDIAALLRLIVPPTLGSVGVTFGGFPIPSVDLATLGESLGGFENRAISFEPARIERAGEGGGYLVVDGSVVEVVGE